MGIGTSLGAFFDSDAHFQAGMDQGIMKPKETNDNNVQTPRQAEENQLADKAELSPMMGIGREIAFKRPLGSSTEPAGALFSDRGTETPDNTSETENQPVDPYANENGPFGPLPGALGRLSWINAFKGMMNPSFDEDKTIISNLADSIHSVISGKVDLNSEEGIRKVNDVASTLVFAPAPVASKMIDGTLGAFAGVGAKTADSNALFRAKMLETLDEHPDNIYRQTGWFRGADQQWRYEIPDAPAKLNENWVKEANGDAENKFTTLPHVLDHPELYKAYPELANTRVIYDPKNPGANADLDFNDIYVGPKYATDKKVLLHEVQHMIQAKEGFDNGSDPSMFLEPKWDKARQAFQEALDKKQISLDNPDVKQLYDRIRAAHRIAQSKYQDVMGEVEARNVMTRSDMTDLERQKYTPLYTEDTPRPMQQKQGAYVPYKPAMASLDFSPIDSAAIKVGDKTYKGVNHADALEKAEAAHGHLDKFEEGYVTKSGDFVDRKQAADLVGKIDDRSDFAKKIGIEHSLASEEIPGMREAGEAYWKDRIKRIHNE